MKRVIPVACRAALGALAVIAGASSASAALEPSVSTAFSQQVDLERFRLLAVQEDGRIKTIDALAREKLKWIDPHLLRAGVDPVLVVLDLVIAPQQYARQPWIRAGKTVFCRRLAREIRQRTRPDQRTGVLAEEALARLETDGVAPPIFFDHPLVREILNEFERDVMRTGKDTGKLYRALNAANPHVLRSLLRVLPDPDQPIDAPWHPLPGFGTSRAPRDAVHAGVTGGGPGEIDPELSWALEASWGRLARAWRFQDAAEANAALEELTGLIESSAPAGYPSLFKRKLEAWYYEWNKLTGAWLIYFLALPFLLMGIAYRMRWAHRAGLGLFVLGFAVQTAAIAIRWHLAGRIPNANMFEAVVASAWFGAVLAIVLEIVLRRRPLAGMSALAASTYAMLALMAGRFMPVALNSDITTVMPVLDRTIWLYIHTNMVIASYALIFFGSVTAALYLAVRLGRRVARVWPRLQAVALFANAGGETRPAAVAAGGAGSLILGTIPHSSSEGGDGGDSGTPDATGMLRALDGATMVFLELAFVTLWFGTILGAVWADVSWGRPWGWDPKEVFALNTWLVFLALLHIRLRVRDKGLWTALLAVAGCAVMLFNWIAVNFVIVGLHSYA